MLFAEYRNHRIAALSKEAGEPFSCFFDPKGLPNKVVHFPIASDFFPGKEDEISDAGVKMRLVAARSGNNLETYLTDALGLKKDVDFRRHANSERGGLIYFDMLTDSAIDRVSDRAQESTKGSAVEHVQRHNSASPSPSQGRQ